MELLCICRPAIPMKRTGVTILWLLRIIPFVRSPMISVSINRRFHARSDLTVLYIMLKDVVKRIAVPGSKNAISNSSVPGIHVNATTNSASAAACRTVILSAATISSIIVRNSINLLMYAMAVRTVSAVPTENRCTGRMRRTTLLKKYEGNPDPALIFRKASSLRSTPFCPQDSNSGNPSIIYSLHLRISL